MGADVGTGKDAVIVGGDVAPGLLATHPKLARRRRGKFWISGGGDGKAWGMFIISSPFGRRHRVLLQRGSREHVRR